MANADSNQSKTFEPFSYLNQDARRYPLANFVECAHDLAAGMSLIMEMVEDCMVSGDAAGEDPRLSPAQQGQLLAFAKASAKLLHCRAYEHMEWLNTHGADQVRKGALQAKP